MKVGINFSLLSVRLFYTLLVVSLVSAVSWLIIGTHRDLTIAFKFIFLLILGLHGFPLIKIITYGITTYTLIQKSISSITKVTTTKQRLKLKHQPDIFYIIVDGYSRDDILQDYFGFDNSAFTNWLRDNNFYIAAESTSNYVMTFMSLASSLNLHYINYLGGHIDKSSPDRMLPYHMIQNNEVVNFLKVNGYSIINLATTYTATESMHGADYTIDNRNLLNCSEFTLMLTHTTALKLFESSVDALIARQMKRNLNFIEDIPAGKKPIFAFIHLLIPHPPFLFNREGNIRTQPPKLGQFLGQEHWQSKKEYIGQLAYLNEQLKKCITKILQRSNNPVIVIQADHGSGSSGPFSDDYLHERFSILNAIYANEATRSRLYSRITPVNTFRVLFNAYFNVKLPILKDRRYFSRIKTPFMLESIEK